MARYQKENHLAKGINEGTNNSKQRENEKRRNEERGTSKERKSPMAKQTRREDRQESRRRAQRKRPETKQEAQNPKGTSGKRHREGRNPELRTETKKHLMEEKGRMAKDSRGEKPQT